MARCFKRRWGDAAFLYTGGTVAIGHGPDADSIYGGARADSGQARYVFGAKFVSWRRLENTTDGLHERSVHTYAARRERHSGPR